MNRHHHRLQGDLLNEQSSVKGERKEVCGGLSQGRRREKGVTCDNAPAAPRKPYSHM